MRHRRSLEKETTPRPKKRPLLRFGRVLLPPERYHTTKKGKRGYTRAERRRAERQARQMRDWA